MKQINLKSEGMSSRETVGIRPAKGMSSIVFGVIGLILSMGVYAGLYYYNVNLSKKIGQLNADQTQKKMQLNSKEYKDLYAYESRLVDLGNLLPQKTDQVKVLDKLSAFTLPETVVESLSVINKDGVLSVDASFSVPDFEVLNRQLKAYTLIDSISNYEPGNVTRAGTESTEIKTSVRFDLAVNSPVGKTAVSQNE